jgi:hypothetical protein
MLVEVLESHLRLLFGPLVASTAVQNTKKGINTVLPLSESVAASVAEHGRACRTYAKASGLSDAELMAFKRGTWW